MTICFKAESREAARQNDISRLRGKTSALIHYVWRADISALARASMDTAMECYHTDLLRYVKRDGHSEEVAATLVRNVLTDHPDLMAAEMTSLMEGAEAGDGVVEHFIVSVQQGDDLLGNFEEAADILVDALGVSNCPVIGAVHSDTDHMHFHLVIIRVDVDTGEVVDLPRYDKIRGQQALAVMEDRFGWKREDNQRWQVVNDRLVLDGTEDVGAADNPREWPDRYFPPPPGISVQGKRAEEKSGYLSAERRVREVIPRIIAEYEDRTAFIAALAKEGIELRKAHRGAAYIVTMEDERGRFYKEQVKASVVRGWGAKALARRYGPIASGKGEPIQSKAAAPVGGDTERPRYAIARSQYRERLNAMCKNVRSALPGGASTQDSLAAARSACVFPSFEEWVAGARPPDIGAVLFGQCGACVLDSGRSVDRSRPEPMLGRDFLASRSGTKVSYIRRGTSNASRVVDFGDKVVLIGRTTDHDIRKALQLLSMRGALVVSGSGFTKRKLGRAKEIAKECGIVVIPHEEVSRIVDIRNQIVEAATPCPAKEPNAVVNKQVTPTWFRQFRDEDIGR